MSTPAPVSTVWTTAARVFAILTLLVLCVSFGTAGVLIQEGRAEDVHGYAAIALHITTGALFVTVATVWLAAWLFLRREYGY